MDRKQLKRWAEQVVNRTLEGMPEPIRERAETVAVHYEWQPNRLLQKLGVEKGTLGLFEGDDYISLDQPVADCPTRIILFLGNLWEFAGNDAAIFREEVETTYLHELGHYLGLGEDDLDERGLQ